MRRQPSLPSHLPRPSTLATKNWQPSQPSAKTLCVPALWQRTLVEEWQLSSVSNTSGCWGAAQAAGSPPLANIEKSKGKKEHYLEFIEALEVSKPSPI